MKAFIALLKAVMVFGFASPSCKEKSSELPQASVSVQSLEKKHVHYTQILASGGMRFLDIQSGKAHLRVRGTEADFSLNGTGSVKELTDLFGSLEAINWSKLNGTWEGVNYTGPPKPFLRVQLANLDFATLDESVIPDAAKRLLVKFMDDMEQAPDSRAKLP